MSAGALWHSGTPVMSFPFIVVSVHLSADAFVQIA
jgi:hypothetical protein